MGKGNVHAVFLGHGADVVGSGDGTGNRGLLLVIGKTLAGKEGRAALRDLNDDRSFDIATASVGKTLSTIAPTQETRST